MHKNIKLERNAYLFSLYLVVALFSFTLTMIGPMAPRLQKEFAMTYSLAGLHQSAYAIGMVIMGVSGAAVIKRFGLFLSVWGGIAIMLLGLFFMVISVGPAFTLGSVLFMSLGGTLAMSSAQAAFAEWQGSARSRVILESNMMASIFTMLVPLVLLFGDRLGWSWRIVLPAMLLAAALTALFGIPAMLKQQHKEKCSDHSGQTEGKPLEKLFWSAWLIVFFGVSVEWALGFWCMSYLLALPNSGQRLASFGVVLLGLSAVLGRFVSSLVSSRISEKRLLIIASLAVLLGFPLYWLRIAVVPSFLGLALCGLGSSNYYPLGLSMALGRARGKENLAASLVPVASGSAIGLAPFLLGRIADSVDMKSALLYIPLATMVIFVLILMDSRLDKKTRALHASSL
ncbi:hypothetical protein MASR2M29_10360 [Spirochaetota bacterium]